MGSLHDAYELGGVAGHGRTTLVRLGVRRGDCSPVALKQLRIEHAGDPDKRRRFVEQARRAAMLHHDGIETVHDVVEGSDGPVAVAEWIDGRSLHRLAIARRRKDEPWPAEQVVLVARTLLEALRHAHGQPTAFDAQGMLHAGLWPGNVLVDVDGRVKIVDFGMALVWQEAREPWQDLEALRYLSADHVRHGASAASDLYGVGAIVHELLSGQRFRDPYETEADMRAAIDQPTPPERPREDVPTPLERVRRRLLEPVPNPRLTLEHVLDLCAAIPVADAREGLAALVQATLRDDSTAPDPEPTPPRGIPLAAMAAAEERDGVAKARSRSSAAVHVAAGDGGGLGLLLEQVPLGQSPRSPRRRDTQSVPIPVDHEKTAPRAPMFLQQTAPPLGEQARAAERERSGSDAHGVPSEAEEVDTAPLPLGGDAIPEPIPEEEDGADLLLEPDVDVTAEVIRIARLPEDESVPPPSIDPATATEASRGLGSRMASAVASWLRGPLGWALLGAGVVGIGAVVLSRCNAPQSGETPSAPADRPTP